MSSIITKVLPGFMELLPDEQIEFDRIKALIEEAYRQYGFTAIDTPVIERTETLLAKAGGETEKQIYQFKKGNTDLSLRFDLTVPLARYAAEHYNDLSFPFRRYHVAKVYRGETPQKGRFREFYQCDIDVIGRNELSIYYEAEIPSIIYRVFKQLDIGKFTIFINNRKLLSGLIEALDAEKNTAEILRAIDKIEKITPDEFTSLLEDQNLPAESIKKIKNFVDIKGGADIVINELKMLNINNELFSDGVSEIDTVTGLMKSMGIDSSYFAIDLSIARGLDYYTGTVYETKLNDYPTIGSICSGGRYDNLVSCYTNERLPGVGISIGLTRLFDQLKSTGLISCSRKTIADVVIIPMDDTNVPCALKTAQQLRDAQFNVDVLLESTSVKKKFQYVSKKDATFTIVIGSEEEKTDSVTVQFKQNNNLIKQKITREKIVEFMLDKYKNLYSS